MELGKQSMIVHLCGMPGVGKLTIARALAEILHARLIDNHLILDLVMATCGRESPQYISMIDEITSVVHERLINNPERDTVIFTNALAKDNPEDEARIEMARSCAAAMGAPFVPVLIHCSAEENAARLTNPERQAKGTLRDETALASLLERYEIAHPRDHVHAIEIDATELSALQAANRIALHVRQCTAVES